MDLSDGGVQLGVIVIIVSTLYIIKSWRSRRQLPPGPIPLPLVGNLLSLGTSNLHLKFTELSKKYGPVFTVYLGRQPTVVINSVSKVREAFLQKGADYAGRPHIFTLDLISDGGRDIAFGQYGPVWKLQRKIAHAAIRKYATGKNLEKLVHNAFANVTANIKDQDKVDVMDFNVLLVYNIIAGMCFSEKMKEDDPFITFMTATIKDLSKVTGGGIAADFVPILQYEIFHTKAVKFVKKIMDEIMVYFNKQFDSHMETYIEDNRNDLTYELIHLWKVAEKEEEDKTVLSQLTKRHFIQIISDMFFAGTDTSRCTLTNLVAFLANYPDVQANVYEEIERVIGKDGDITLETKKELHYLQAVLYESMRLATIIPLGLPHATTCDTTLGDYAIPKGTQVMFNSWAIHRDSGNFEEPETFKPERWIDESGSFQYQAYSFLSFSMGKRVCVGESLAKAEFPMILALLLQKYKFERIAQDPIPLEGTDSFGLLEPKPFKVVFKLR